MANSLDSDGGDVASLHQNFVDSTVVAPSNLQSSNGTGGLLAADSSAESTDKSAAVPVEESTRGAVVQESHECGAVVSNIAELSVKEQKPEGLQVECSEKCANETQVIEHASLVEPSVGGDGDFVDINDSKRNTKEQEPKEKKQRRRGGKNRRNTEVSYSYPIEKREKKGQMYSREELESLRFENVEEQKKKWVEVYCGLGAQVVDEYNGLVGLDRARGKNSIPNIDFDPRPQLQKSVNSGEVCFPEVGGDHLESLNVSDPSSIPYEDDDSDEEYSIQKPAFMVTGEPDFDSGPPLDGLEYLRRVRWEAARIPKVKVAKVKKVKEQSIYMPQIPEVMKCPEKLLPLKQWEDSFLSDFSQLREAFTRLDLQELGAETSVKEDLLNQMLDRNTFDKFGSLESADDSCILETSDAASTPSSPDSYGPKVDRPTLSRILKMDSATRTSMLKKQVSASMNMDRLPYNHSLWLFALCATVDCPLLADTSAALRSLLRKCASLRAAKTEVDDEVITLNILATIAGRYFGQLERE